MRTDRWRAQFKGKSYGDAVKLGKDIQNISGATLSCKHVSEGVRRARHLRPHPQKMSIFLERTHRRTLYATFALLWISGASWLVFHYFLPCQTDFGPAASARPWSLKVHGLRRAPSP